MSKHDAVMEYFKPKIEELSESELSFNNSQEKADTFSLTTNYSEKIRKKYVRIGAEKEYAFTIIIVKAYSTEEDDLNLIAMNMNQEFMEWLEEQNRLKNYPKFPKNCQIKKMECIHNMPNMAGINSEEALARYMIQCRIIYFEKEIKG